MGPVERCARTARLGEFDHVVTTLGSAIARGDYDGGSVPPREAELEAQLGVGHGVVRAAVKLLAAKSLVIVGPRHGTRVRPRRPWNFLDRDVFGWVGAGSMARDLLLALEKMRRVVEPAAAALAAGRASLAERQAIRAAYAAIAATQSDVAATTQADKAFHVAILDATRNLVLDSFRYGLEAILDAVLAGAIPALAPNLPSHKAVLEAIKRADPGAARAAMERLLDVTNGYLAGLGQPPSEQELAA
jgi:GntR family galactonate operon transcriptional repressor